MEIITSFFNVFAVVQVNLGGKNRRGINKRRTLQLKNITLFKLKAGKKESQRYRSEILAVCGGNVWGGRSSGGNACSTGIKHEDGELINSGNNMARI